MTLLPIVERELRVAARRKSTYRIRSWTAAAAMLSLGSLIVFLGGLVKPASAGHTLFAILTDCTFALCLLAGVFLTADCLSVEKREGTLGLLFLTDLKGSDVVLGKFAANSLSSFYGLLAVFPVMAIPLLLGGVTGGEFWHMTLALGNALFVSLSAGIWISALYRGARRAMNATFGLLVFLVGGLPALAKIAYLFEHSRGWSWFAVISPATPFWDARETAYRADSKEFWCSLFASQLLGWLFVALASLALPHRWQERPKAAPAAENFSNWPRSSSVRPAQRSRAREEWLDINPVLWLIGSNRAVGAAAWVVVLTWGAMMAMEMLFAPRSGEALLGNLLLAWPFAFVLKSLFALETCRFFAEARRNGAMELLLATSLSDREIIHGQRLALKRTFMLPVALYFGFWLLPTVAAEKVSGSFALGFAFWGSLVVLAREAAGFLAVYWFGTWLALTARKPRMAAPLTILFAAFLPSLLCVMDLLPYLLLITLAASRMQQGLRKLLAQEFQRGPNYTASRAAPEPSPVPPVIRTS